LYLSPNHDPGSNVVPTIRGCRETWDVTLESAHDSYTLRRRMIRMAEHSHEATPEKSRITQLGTETDLDTFVSETSVALVEFYTDGCGICQSMEPVLSNLARGLEIPIGTVNPRDDPPLIDRFEYRVSHSSFSLSTVIRSHDVPTALSAVTTSPPGSTNIATEGCRTPRRVLYRQRMPTSLRQARRQRPPSRR